MIGGKVPLRRRALLMDALVAGELLTDDFLRCELSRTRGELALETLDISAELVLMVRSRAGATGAAKADGVVKSVSCSGNSENQLSGAINDSPWNMGEVSKLSLIKGESLMSGEVMLVKVVEGGAD